MDILDLLQRCREHLEDLICVYDYTYADDDTLLIDINDAIEELEFKG